MFIFAHGWGFDAHFWDPVIDELSLPNDTEILKLDFGYTGHSIDIRTQQNLICVGHSLGCLWLLKHIKHPKAFIAINGFDCFFRHTHKVKIQKMRRNLERNPDAQMRGFYDACGVNKQTSDLPNDINWNADELKTGLHWLETWDQSAEREQLLCPVKAICSKDDQIISDAASSQIWKSTDLIFSDFGGHVLPLTRPRWCTEHIKNVIDN